MDQLIGGAAATADGANLIKNGSTATFMADVVDASREAAIIVDFWAPWCGPCKQLGPALEKAVRDARGAVRLVKINVDENPDTMMRYGVRSIPTLILFKNGEPTAMQVGAVPKSRLSDWIRSSI